VDAERQNLHQNCAKSLEWVKRSRRLNVPFQGQSSASKGPYRPLSPRVGPQAAATGLKPRQVIVSSPGSPSSSSDSQSGSDSVKHCLPSRVSSPAIRASPSTQTMMMRSSPSVTISSPGIRNSPSSTSVNSPGPRNSPSVSSLSRASPSILGGNVSRSSSPAMQATSAGLNVTLGSTTPSFSTLSSLQSTISNISTTASTMFGLNYAPTTYASTNPFLTGAYLNYTPGEMSYGDKFNTIGSIKETKSFFENYSCDSKYSSTKPTYEVTESMYPTADTKYNTIGSKYPEKTSYLSTTYTSELKYSPGRETKSGSSYDTSPNVTQSSSSALLSIEDTPTPTSSIETEDSNTREVGEKDVEGDGEQSD
jgi:hypothetical protein